MSLVFPSISKVHVKAKALHVLKMAISVTAANFASFLRVQVAAQMVLKVHAKYSARIRRVRWNLTLCVDVTV
jgi:predicted DNA-binding ribbon-helix-helix protein